MPPGRSLCRLGFPFNNTATTFDEVSRTFTLAPQMTFFPNDGIFTRSRVKGTTADGKHDVLFVTRVLIHHFD